MIDKCEKYGEHYLDCKCPSHWSETEEGKQQLLDILNETFWFHKDGKITRKDESCDVCKNELIFCVCL